MKKNSFVAMVLGSISVLFFRTGHVYDNRRWDRSCYCG